MERGRRIALVGLLAAASVAAGAATPEYVDALVWNAERMAPDLPEAVVKKEFAPKDWLAKPSFGIAFSGGGTRAASAALGQLRALVAMGWWPKVRYLSTSSGGTWATLPFTYLPRAFDDADYLGPLIAPQALTEADFKQQQPAYRLARLIADAKLTQPMLQGYVSFQGDESFSRALGKVFLRPYGLDDPGRSFAWSRAHVEEIVARNTGCFDAPSGAAPPLVRSRRPCVPHSHHFQAAAPGEADPFLAPEDFYLPRAGRPFHIVNASVLSERSMLRMKLPDPWLFPLEITPYYTGVLRKGCHPFFPKTDCEDASIATGSAWTDAPERPDQKLIGGALVESFAYDSWPPQRVVADVAAPPAPGVLETYRARMARERYRFTLADLMGASGASPQQVTSAIGFRNLGFAEFNHWALGQDGAVARPLQHELAHGDAGHVDNLALPPLLERGVRNALVFVNGLYAFSASQGRPDYPIDERSMSHQLRDYFDPDHLNFIVAGIAGETSPECRADARSRARCALQDVYDTFKKAQAAGRPLVHCAAYDINTANTRYRLQPAAQPTRICWAYLDASEDWLAALGPGVPQELRLDLRLRRNAHRHFPHYHTFLENPELKDLVQYKVEQVTALSQLTGWSLCASAAQIAAAFGELNLPPGCAGVPAQP